MIAEEKEDENLVACEQAPGEPERSEGACRHSIDAAVL